MITQENVKRFETLLDLFSHPGWGLLMDEFDFKEQALKEQFVQFGISPELLAFGQGRLSVYRELASLSPVLRNALEENNDNVEETSI